MRQDRLNIALAASNWILSRGQHSKAATSQFSRGRQVPPCRMPMDAHGLGNALWQNWSGHGAFIQLVG